MKSNSLIKVILALFLFTAGIPASHGQSALLDGFSVKVSPGALSYFGDMSTSDINLPKRIVQGSKFGFSAGVIKQFIPAFGLQAQFTAGSLYTSALNNTYFAGKLTEYSLSARFDPLKVQTAKTYRFSPYISAGVGLFSYRSVRREMDTNVVLLPTFGYEHDGVTNAKRQSAMSMPLAIGVSYVVAPGFEIELEHALRLTNTDLLDCFKGAETANDLFSLTSVGLRYTIGRQPVRSSSRQRSRKQAPITKTVKPAEPVAVVPETNIYIDCEIPETVQPGQTFDVKLRINKGQYRGPGKLTQKFPAGYSATENPRYTNSFLFNNQTVIIEWHQMPADSTVTYSYLIKAGGKVSGSQTITGRFEYQENGDKAVRFNKSFYIQEDKPKIQAVKDPNATGDRTGEVFKADIRKSVSLEGIEFRVQCGAFRDRSQAFTDLAAKYKISEVIQEEFIDGWYKFTVGSFRTYEEAIQYRDRFIQRTRLNTSFLVAYKDGRRFADIREALK